jgi:hypothetical protein
MQKMYGRTMWFVVSMVSAVITVGCEKPANFYSDMAITGLGSTAATLGTALGTVISNALFGTQG